MGKKKNRKRRTESMRMNVLIFSVQFNSKMVQVTAILYSRNPGHAWNISNFMHTEKKENETGQQKTMIKVKHKHISHLFESGQRRRENCRKSQLKPIVGRVCVHCVSACVRETEWVPFFLVLHGALKYIV